MGVKKQSSRFQKVEQRQIEGRNPVREALRARTPVIKVVLEEQMNRDERIEEIIRLTRLNKIPIEKLPSKTLRKISKTGGHHQGVIAYAEVTPEIHFNYLLEQLDKTTLPPFLLIIPEVLYEQNFGAILRSAEASGVDAVIVSNRVETITPVVSHTSMGASEHIPVIHTNLFIAIKALKDRGFLVAGTMPNANRTLYNLDLTRRLALVIGSEDTGISEPIQKLLDCSVSIPMLGNIESLNMSVAAAICMYEVVRQRRYTK